MNEVNITICLVAAILIVIIILCALIKIVGPKKIQKLLLEPEQCYDNRSTAEIYYETAIKQRRYMNIILTLILITLVIIAIPAYFQILAIINSIYH